MLRFPLASTSLCVLLAACAGESLAPGHGRLRISLTISGLDLDPDGGHVTVDDATRVAVRPGGAVTVDIHPGMHTLVLGGLTEHCLAEGDGRRELEVRAGESRDVPFLVTCGAATGVVEVRVSTAGVDPDPNGYLVSVDHVLAQRIQEGTTGRFAPIPGGGHAVYVDDVADNCAVVGGTPVTGISVATGTPVRDTVRVAVSIACVSRIGTLRIITSTSGTPDSDGYLVDVGRSSLTLRVAANDTLATNLPAGNYAIQLSDVAEHCQVTGRLPNSASIVTGDTAELRLTVSCQTLAELRVAAPTAGASPDPVYVVWVDGGGGYTLLAGTTLPVVVLPGDHRVELTDIAWNCAVDGPNPVAVSAAAGTVTDVVFPVTCATVGNTGVDITIVTTGSNPDGSYLLTVCTEPEWDCYAASYSTVAPANATLQVDLAPGSYYVSLYDVARNCRADWSGLDPEGKLVVTAGERVALRIDVTCLGNAEFTAAVTTTGTDRQREFRLTVDGEGIAWLTADSAVTASVVEGVHAIGLQNIQENCRATSPNPVTLTLVPGVPTPVQFAVDCQSVAVLEVAVSTTGNNLPPGFVVGLDPDWLFGDGYAYSTAITPNGTVTMKLNLGEHAVWLDQVPAHCSVQGANPRPVTAELGATLAVAFAVTCQ